MKCKICGGQIIQECRCARRDVTCEHGHSYHWSHYHNEYHEGISDHSTDTLSPDCCQEKKKVNVKFLDVLDSVLTDYDGALKNLKDRGD